MMIIRDQFPLQLVKNIVYVHVSLVSYPLARVLFSTLLAALERGLFTASNFFFGHNWIVETCMSVEMDDTQKTTHDLIAHSTFLLDTSRNCS